MGTKNNSDSFVSSVISSSTNTFSTSHYQYIGTGSQQLVASINNPGRTNSSKPALSTPVGKHRLPMQLSRPPTTGSVGVSVITPAVGVNQSPHKEVHFKQQLQHMQKIQSVRNTDGFNRSCTYSSNKLNSSPPNTGVTITPINSAYMPSKSKIVAPPPTASMVYSHTQHLPKYISSSRFLVNTEKGGDVYNNDDVSLGEMPDKRTQYCNYLPPDYQHVLQDHSYSQLPESPPPPPTPPTPVQQRTTINGLNNRISSSTTSVNVTLNNNRIVNAGSVNAPLTNNVSGGRLNNQNLLIQANNSMNSYSTVSAIVNSVATNIHNNTATSVIAVNPKKNVPNLTPNSLSNVPKSLLKTGVFDRRDESDLSEDDRIPDPHGEETETAPEAEGEEESITRCICDFQHDDGYMISCDKCLAWQHVDCMGIDWHQIPDEYQCEKCQPRFVDKRRAVELQKKKIAEKLCIGVNDDSDSSDAPTPARGKNQTKRKYKGRRTNNNKKKNVKDLKDNKQKRTPGTAKKRQFSESLTSSPPTSPSPLSNSNLTAEKKKQLLMERKQMLLEKKQITKKRSMRKQAQSTKRNLDKSKLDDDYEHRSTPVYNTDKDEDSDHSIHQVREWVDRYEEAVTNHYSQELRARLSAVQVNGVHSDLKYSTTLRTVEKCKTSLLSTGGKIVLATCSLSPNQPIIELRGKYMWTGAASFKQNNISPSTPYVFYYRLPKQDIEICVDCRTYGNFARFVRRSCKPNSELRHCIRKTSLHLYIIATQALKKNSEILIGHFSPETAGSCVCGSPESCTAAKTPYPPPSSRYGDKHSKESHLSPAIGERHKKTPLNADKGKRRLKEDTKKLTKEKRRGRRKSPSSGSNSDQESSSRDQSPSLPSKLTVNMWAKPINSNNDLNKINSDHENHTESPLPSPTLTENQTTSSNVMPMVLESTNGNSAVNNVDSAASDSESAGNTPTINNNTSTLANNSTPKQNARTTRNSEHGKKEKHQLDMPWFSQTPNNHKMTREEKKIQAIMKAFEQMEKTEARKQESQKHRRESTSDAETYGKKTPCRKGMKSRKSTDDGKEDKFRKDEDGSKSRKNSQTEDEEEYVKSENSFNHRLNSVKDEPQSEDVVNCRKSYVVENGNRSVKTEDEDSEDTGDEKTDNEDERPDCVDDIKKFGSPKKMSPSGYTSPNSLSPIKVNNKMEEKHDSSIDKESGHDNITRRRRNEGTLKKTALQSPAKSKLVKTEAKARVTSKTKILRGKKRRNNSDAEGTADDAGDISERTRSAVQRQKKGVNSKISKDDKTNEKKNASSSPGKFKKVDDSVVSPFSTPPKTRERLDSSSSSGGTPPTPVSDTCLLVASAIGHLTDFKFPNTKKELMNAWFKEERKPSPEEEIPSKLSNQESNNEYAKKRWLRQAISEEGDSSVPRPEEVVSPNGDHGGPLKKRRFARESMSEQTCSSPTTNTFINSNQISFDDDDDVPSPDASLFRASEGGVQTYHPTQLQNEVKPVTEELETVLIKAEDSCSVSNTISQAISTIDSTISAIGEIAASSLADKEESVVTVVNNVLSSVLSAVNSIESQHPLPPPPPPRPCTPPQIEPPKKPEASPPISKKKLSLTEYQQRKNTTTPAPPPCGTDPTPGDVIQEVPLLASAPPPTIDPAETVERSSSRSSITSSSCSEEEDNSHAASAQVIARSLMIESRHLSYGPQASALFNSIRSGSLGQATAQTFNSKSTGLPLPRENLADRLKREFDVHVQEDEAEKRNIANASAMPPPLSPIKIHVQMPTELPLQQKDLHMRLKKIQPPPPPPPLPAIPPPTLPPLPEPPQLFAPYYPYSVPRVPSFFAAPPPPPPPPVPPPVPFLPPPPPPPPPK